MRLVAVPALASVFVVLSVVLPVVVAVVLPVVLVASCSAPECVDVDRDGYGPHCDAGADCDAENATRNVDCVAVPAPDCTLTPEAPGCPCFPGATAACYLGAAGTEGVGACRAGTASCPSGFYDLCTGDVGPELERCNDRDDDCDGRVDEYVLSPCGGCDSGCAGVVWGPGGTGFEVTAGLVLTDAGAVTLDRTPIVYDGIWITNDGEDTVSHLSATSALEVARHATGGDVPARVAVDYRGDVFVTNAAFGAQGTLTKLGGTPAGCVDRNGMSGIETSTGPADVPLVADDECVVFVVPVGTSGEVPRALAVDGSFEAGGGGGGDPWVGLEVGEAVVHVDGETGAELERIELPGFRPFAATFDSLGGLWLASQAGEFVRIDRGSSPIAVERILVNLACYSIYDIAIAEDGALLASGFGCDQVFRYDPRDGRVRTLATLESPRGITADDGFAYASHADGRLSIVPQDLRSTVGTIDAWALGLMPIESTGVASDSLGFVWMISAQGAMNGRGVATRIDPVTATVLAQVPLGVGPQGLGDSTGGALRGVFEAMGTTSTIVPGCGGTNDTNWIALHVQLDSGSASTTRLEVRSASTVAGLPNVPFVEIGSYPGSAPDLPLTGTGGGPIEIRLTLESGARDSAPVVQRVGVQYNCVIE